MFHLLEKIFSDIKILQPFKECPTGWADCGPWLVQRKLAWLANKSGDAGREGEGGRGGGGTAQPGDTGPVFSLLGPLVDKIIFFKQNLNQNQENLKRLADVFLTLFVRK